MKYEIRYMLNSDERDAIVEGESAAEAVDIVRNQQQLDTDDAFELIQVSLIDEEPAPDDEPALA